MAILICPACGAGYEIQAVFPPGGRKARCYKCGQIWLATPVATPLAESARPAPPAEPGSEPAPAEPASEAAPPGSTSGAASVPETVAAPVASSPPQSAAAVSLAQAFSGIQTAAAQPEAHLAEAELDQDLAAHVGRINKKLTAQPVAPSVPEERGGIFARLDRRGVPPVAPPASSAGMSDAAMTDAIIGAEAMMDDAFPRDAEMGIEDSAWASQASPDEHPARWKPLVLAIGWLVLALVVASVIGTIVLARSAVVSALPGAARLYTLFGAPVGLDGLAFEGVRYSWTSEGGQDVLEVQGSVLNNTSSSVAVPTLVIALQDERDNQISQWTTEATEQELAAGEHASFLRQIPSPPSNVRSVKVHFAKPD
jgi:predicted Zn finger-like uncharacterized protein